MRAAEDEPVLGVLREELAQLAHLAQRDAAHDEDAHERVVGHTRLGPHAEHLGTAAEERACEARAERAPREPL